MRVWAVLISVIALQINASSGVCQETQCGSLPGDTHAVILSPGPTVNVPWGGYHITIAGYSNRHACRKNAGTNCYTCRALLPILRATWRNVFRYKSWHLHKPLDTLKHGEDGWRLNIKSTLLGNLASQLSRSGFQSLKGPKYAHFPWHVSLHVGRKAQARELVKKLEKSPVHWYLWLAPEAPAECKDEGVHCPKWQRVS